MTHHQIDIQSACDTPLPVTEECLVSWVKTALDEHHEAAEITVRLVNIPEITELNKVYRKLDKSTNVLAFPGNIPDTIPLEYPFLGDVIICPDVIKSEAKEQNITFVAHFAHIVIHGVLHLLGYDHIEKCDFQVMQSLEIKLLSSLGFANPYHQMEDNNLE